ncbi:MAG: PilZ domain-containing protein [Candidatus Methylomirabilales bacterium]
MEQPQQERRQHPRWVVAGRLTGRIDDIETAALIDLGPAGAQIEHGNIVRPGPLATLILLIPGRDLSLTCRVVWSRVLRPETRAPEKRQLIYRTGLQFLYLSEATQRLLDGYLESLKDGR